MSESVMDSAVQFWCKNWLMTGLFPVSELAIDRAVFGVRIGYGQSFFRCSNRLWTELFLAVSESAMDRSVPGVRIGYGQSCFRC